MSKITDKWIDDNKTSIVESLRGLIRIPSVEGEADLKATAPFGLLVRNAEDYVIGEAQKLGLNAKDGNGYFAFVDKDVDSSKEMLGIVTHLDVVPEGLGWTHPAFGAEIVDDTIFGRGAIDDKGPAIASLYALKAVIESGYSLKRGVRLIFGLNEETNMKCLEKYLETERVPDISFTPDGSYPLCNHEFGICHASFSKRYSSCIKFNSGVAANVVPPLAKASANGRTFETKGIQAHASTPWEGENAAQKMIKLLNGLDGLNAEDKEVLLVLDKYLGEGYLGESFGLAYSDKAGKLTLNLGLVSWDENGFDITLDLRCPNPAKEDRVKEALLKAFEECGASLSSFTFSKGFYLKEDTELVDKLMKVYQKRTGDTKSRPIAMGGGTYARHLPNAVSFGPEGYMGACSCHVPDEYITVEQLTESAKMIADAIIALACE